jgi:hypothetical protein
LADAVSEGVSEVLGCFLYIAPIIYNEAQETKGEKEKGCEKLGEGHGFSHVSTSQA